MKLVFEGESLAEINQQVLAYNQEVNAKTGPVSVVTQVYSIPTADLVAEEQSTNLTSEGHVVSDGKVWRPSDRASNAFYPEAINDSRGIPFDQRIHVSPEKKNKDGSWLNKRVGKEKVAEVEAELRAKHGVQAPAAAPKVAPFGGMTADQYAGHVERGNQAAQMPPMMPPPAATPAPSLPPAPVAEIQMGMNAMHSVDTFKKNLPFILMELTNAGKITQAYIDQLKGWLQVPELVNVIGDANKTQALFDTWVQHNIITKA